MEISAVGRAEEITRYASASGGRVDPYVIYQMNFEALGGEKNVKSASTFYCKGEMDQDGYKVSIEEYISKPLKNLRIISNKTLVLLKDGNDGQKMWADRNGKVSTVDYSSLPAREVQQMWAEYAYMDRNNTMFTSTSARKVSVDGASCYEIKIRNNVTDEIVTQYYDAKTFLLKRELRETDDSRTQTDYSDYRTVDNIKMAFKVDKTDLKADVTQSIIWDMIEKDVFILDSLFTPPDDNSRPKNNAALLRQIGANLDAYA